MDLSGVEIYIGAPIEVVSERKVFLALIKRLSEARAKAVVFANFHVGGRQLDFLVATDSATLVIEAKAFSSPVQGGVNGLWAMKLSGGLRRSVGNPYVQALAQKNALCDALGQFGFEHEGYPDAAVVITPRIPKGSGLPPDDFKVAITDLHGLSSARLQPTGLAMPISQWRSFASAIHLRRVETPQEALDQSLLKHRDLLAGYRAEFERLHSADARSLLTDTYLLDSIPSDPLQVAARAGFDGDDLLIGGPSGCGKTLLAKKIALQGLDCGQIPVLIQAKYFTGKLQELVEREVSLLGVPTSKDLIRSVLATGCQLLLIVDGYNECRSDLQLALTRSLAAVTKRYGCRLVISTQLGISRPDLISPVSVTVSRPGNELKAAISGIGCESGSGHLRDLLDSVSSGFEADLVGRVGSELAEGASRFALFDAYARKKLGADQFDGVRLLAAVAKHLVDRVSFSLSVRELDRLADDQRVSGDVLGRIFATDMVVRRGDRVSFRHELIQCAFVAESVARASRRDVDKALDDLLTPMHHTSRSLILGAYDDDELLVGVLSTTVDADLIRRAAAGECGSLARSWVTAASTRVMEKLAHEASILKFSPSVGIWGGGGCNWESTLYWTPSELALMPTICDQLWVGRHIEVLLGVAGTLDLSLDRAFYELQAEPGIKKRALLDGLFADTYVFGHEVGMARLIRVMSDGLTAFRRRESALPDAVLGAWTMVESAGQMYLMLILTRFSGGKEAALPYILPFLGDRWSGLPYHLRLELLHYTHLLNPKDESCWRELVDALEALLPSLNPIFSGMVVEALEGMGALEDQSFEYSDVVKVELQAILSGPCNAESCKHAWAAYLCQFDHPFSSRYFEAINELGSDEKKEFLRMACLGAEDPGIFLTSVIQELAESNDPLVAPALRRWLELPKVESFMPQEAIAAFIWAHAAFGMLGMELPARQLAGQSMAGLALESLGDLYYWIHRGDLAPSAIEAKSSGALKCLIDPHQTGVASVLRLVVDSTAYEGEMRESVMQRFPALVMDVCRRCLQNPEIQTAYFPHFKHDVEGVVKFSIDVLGSVGEHDDLLVLRRLSRDPINGASAISAIRMIEERTVR